MASKETERKFEKSYAERVVHFEKSQQAIIKAVLDEDLNGAKAALQDGWSTAIIDHTRVRCTRTYVGWEIDARFSCSAHSHSPEACTALLLACETGSLPMVCFLIDEAGADATFTPRRRNEEEEREEAYSPLWLACLHGHARIVRYLVKMAGVSIDQQDDVEKEKENFDRCPMSLLAKVIGTANCDGSHKVLQELLDCGADVNAQVFTGRGGCSVTLLHRVLSLVEDEEESFQTSVIERLKLCRFEEAVVKMNCYYSSTEYEGSALCFAASNKCLGESIFHYLVQELHADPYQKVPDPNDGYELLCPGGSALHYAAANIHLVAARYFVQECGASAHVDDRDDKDSSPLMCLCAQDPNFDAVELAQLLVASNADVNAHNHHSPLISAASESNLGLVKYLVEAKADPFWVNGDGKTALVQALAANASTVADFLTLHCQEQRLITLAETLPLELQWWCSDSFAISQKALPQSVSSALLQTWGKFRRNTFDEGVLQITSVRGSVLSGLCDALVGDNITGLDITFEDEGAAGDALRRDFYKQVREELCSESHGLFCNRHTGLEPLPGSGVGVPDHLVHFELLGKIMVLALSYGEVIPGFEMSCPFRKLILGHQLTPSDLQLIDPDLHRSAVQRVLTSDVSDWGLTFVLPTVSIPGDNEGNLHKRKRDEVELKPGGAALEVTQSNKKEYSELLAVTKVDEYCQAIQSQTAAFIKGMQTVFGNEASLKRFQKLVTPSALDSLIAGSATISVDEWEQSTTYESDTDKVSKQVKWFWSFLRSADEATRSLVLEFATGCGRVPAAGFSRLSGYSERISPFCIMILPYSVESRLCLASSCFNTLKLRAYPTSHEQEEWLLRSVTESSGFQEGLEE